MRMRNIAPVMLAAGIALLSGTAGAAEIKWSKSFDTAMAEARQTKKLVMADFYTDW